MHPKIVRIFVFWGLGSVAPYFGQLRYIFGKLLHKSLLGNIVTNYCHLGVLAC